VTPGGRPSRLPPGLGAPLFEIGSTLRQARERRRLGLDQAEAETKIRARYLRALEEEQFDVLPGPAYIKGFLRTYAEYLGLDGTLFVDEYNSRFSDPFRDEELIFPRRRSQPPHRSRHRRESNVVLIALAGIVAVAVLVAVAFMYPTERPPQTPATTPTETATAPDTTAVEESSSLEALVNPIVSAAQEDAKQRKEEQQEEQTGTGAAKPLKPVKLILRATDGQCWVVVHEGTSANAEAEPLFADTLDPLAANGGKSQRFTSKKGFVVEIGKAGNLELVVNGKVQSPGTALLIRIDPDGTVSAIDT
jgi:cytoskeleton protein RodZ